MKVNYREIVVNNMILRGFFSTPDDGKYIDLVVMLHGYTGHKNETSFLFKQINEKLCAAGYATLRYDYRGSGDSDGDFSMQNFNTVKEDAIASINDGLLINQNKPIILLGFSMGGATAAVMTARFGDEKVKKAVLISPAGDMPLLTRNTFFGKKLIDDQYLDYGGYYGNVEYMHSFENVDLYQGLETFHNDVLIIQGLEDLAVFPEYAMRYWKTYPNARLVYIPKATHGYNKVSQRKEIEEYLVNFIKKGIKK